MRITLEFDSTWQTRFLSGGASEPASKNNKREFIATASKRGEKPATITKDTVMGVLCRLIGYQKKLYQIRATNDYYFNDIERNIGFALDEKNLTNKETVYLTNKSNSRCAQSIFLGVLDDDSPLLHSDIAKKIWSVLYLDVQELFDFILSERALPILLEDSSLKMLILRVEELSDSKCEVGAPLKTYEYLVNEKKKAIEKELKRNKSSSIQVVSLDEADKKLSATERNGAKDMANVLSYLHKKYPSEKKYVASGLVSPIRLYAAALYLQCERLLELKHDLGLMINKKGEISVKGFSKRGFHGQRDWLNQFTGSRKKAVGTPCLIDKRSGKLEITIDVDRDRARDIASLIDNAGVSSFYLGKKGLAYVSAIKI